MSEKELERKNKIVKVREEGQVELEDVDENIKEVLREEIRDLSVLRILEKEFIRNIREKLKKFSSIDYPDWINQSWSRIKPHENFLEYWYEKWAEILLLYSRRSQRFRLSLQELVNMYPFFDGERSISIEDARRIVDKLCDRGIAKWLDSNKLDFLIYWIPKEELIEYIYDEAKKLGLIVLRLKVIKEALNDLPHDELIEIMTGLVNKNYGKWIAFKVALKISYPL